MTTGDGRAGEGAGDPGEQRVHRRLRSAGLRATRPRVHILHWLDTHPGHHAAEDVVDRTGLPKATVYHVLGQLRAEGLIAVADAGPGRTLYETSDAPAHHHFVCRRCGRVIDVPAAQVPAAASPDVTGAVVDSVDVILRGRCDVCAVG